MAAVGCTGIDAGLETVAAAGTVGAAGATGAAGAAVVVGWVAEGVGGAAGAAVAFDWELTILSMTLTARCSCEACELRIRWHHEGGGQLHSSAFMPVVRQIPYAMPLPLLRGGGRCWFQLPY